jgi:hypothetical protein
MNSVALSDLPVGAIVAFAVYGVFQIGFEIYALIEMFKTPEDRLVFGKRWPWVLIILFINLIGAVVFLVAGRKPVIAADQPGAQSLPDVNRARRATDVLYGGKDGE